MAVRASFHRIMSRKLKVQCKTRGLIHLPHSTAILAHRHSINNLHNSPCMVLQVRTKLPRHSNNKNHPQKRNILDSVNLEKIMEERLSMLLLGTDLPHPPPTKTNNVCRGGGMALGSDVINSIL